MNNSKYDHWTDGVRLNQGFARVLFEHCEPPLYISNKDAYVVYEQFHAAKPTYISTVKQGVPTFKPIHDNSFLQMNVRNQLCKMAYMGIIVRIRNGVYRWNENWACYSSDAFADHLAEAVKANKKQLADQLMRADIKAQDDYDSRPLYRD